MLCSNCNTSVKPVVAIDIDGTIGQWHQLWFKFAEGYFGRKFHRHYTGNRSLAEYMQITKEQYREAKLVFRQGSYKRTMLPYEHAAEFVQGLVTSGFEVWMTTTRPYLRLDNLDPDTREWLRRNDIPFDGLLYDEDKYARLIEIVGQDRIVAVLDDELANYDRALQLDLEPLLMRREHNQTAEVLKNVVDFKEAFKVMAARQDRWRMALNGA